MSEPLPLTYAVRHGQTAWSLTGQHTGRKDLPLTETGERDARSIGVRLGGKQFAQVFTSPLQRATRTCELAGFRTVAQVDPDLIEWDYGQYEGRRAVEIYKERPDWFLFRDGCPGGETPQDVADRADRVVSRVRAIAGDVLLFSSGHILRMVAARWLGLEPIGARYLHLSTAGLCMLGYEHNRSQAVIKLWNDTSHVG